MADGTHIEWTDATWNIVTGCSVVSPGCTNCYAMKLAGTRLRHHPSRQGLTVESKAGPVWNGQVRFNAEWLDQPLRWTKPRRIFVAAHGDLFHDGVTDEQLDQIFAVMALTPRHTYQVLTKRPERMRTYLTAATLPARLGKAIERQRLRKYNRNYQPATRAEYSGPDLSYGWGGGMAGDTPDFILPWPFPNVWLGVSVEDQARADERIPILLDTPAAVRWISAEPLLGPVDLSTIDVDGDSTLDALMAPTWQELLDEWPESDIFEESKLESFLDWHGRTSLPDGPAHKVIDWVVAGGESGPDARPMHPFWAIQLRDQCAAAGVPFLFKQWGDWAPADSWDDGDASAIRILRDGSRLTVAEADPGQGMARMRRIGKRRAGRLLLGALHDAFPTTSEGQG